jgi:hypothetical protein
MIHHGHSCYHVLNQIKRRSLFSLIPALLDRRMGTRTHSVALTVDICPSQEQLAHGKPNVHLDLSDARHEATLPGGYSKAKLVEAVKEGVEGGCLQGV